MSCMRQGVWSTSVDHGAPDDRWRSGGRVGRCHTVGSPTPRQHCPLSEFNCPVRVTQVSSLWTPGGEHPVDPESTTASSGALEAEPGSETEPESEAEAEIRAELDEVRRQLAQVPPEVVIANHAMGLYELAAIHLSQDPPSAPAAALAIDAMGALVDGLTGRLGDAEPTLRDALSQLRLIFVQLTSGSS